MGNRSAYVALVRSVRKQFSERSIDATVATLARNARYRNDDQGPGGANRVAFFEPEDGDRGELVQGHRAASTNPRVIREWQRPFTISIWAIAPGTTRDEEELIEAWADLHDQVWQALVRAADDDGQPIGVVQVGKMRAGDPANTEAYFGKEQLLDFVIKEAVLDIPLGVAFVSPSLSARTV